MAGLKSLLAGNIKFHRKIQDLTQEALAEKVGTVSTYIAMIESEKRTPSLMMIERIAKALKVEASELFSTKDYPFETPSQIREVLINQFDQFLRASAKEIEKNIENTVY
jgi:transcriptional regulator with XRE-family HTH domain